MFIKPKPGFTVFFSDLTHTNNSATSCKNVTEKKRSCYKIVVVFKILQTNEKLIKKNMLIIAQKSV